MPDVTDTHVLRTEVVTPETTEAFSSKAFRVLWYLHLPGRWAQMTTIECSLPSAAKVYRAKVADPDCRRVLLQVEDNLPNWRTVENPGVLLETVV